jgi:hypothetical protein
MNGWHAADGMTDRNKEIAAGQIPSTHSDFSNPLTLREVKKTDFLIVVFLDIAIKNETACAAKIHPKAFAIWKISPSSTKL